MKNKEIIIAKVKSKLKVAETIPAKEYLQEEINDLEDHLSEVQARIERVKKHKEVSKQLLDLEKTLKKELDESRKKLKALG